MPRLADLAPSVLGALGIGDLNPLALPRVGCVCILLIDGLGDELLAQHAELAPMLSALRHSSLEVGYPSSTPTSLATLSTGLEPGVHGLLGVTTLIDDVPLQLLYWEIAGADARAAVNPRRVQQHRTLFQRVRSAGLSATQIGPAVFENAGFTDAVFRGGDFRGLAPAEDLATATAAAMADAGYVYSYTPILDRAGHVFGSGSEQWLDALAATDAMVTRLVARVPPDSLLLVTGDHGMVDVEQADRLDLDLRPDLLTGVRVVAGEPRALALHCEPGHSPSVASRWRDELAGSGEVATRQEALQSGWFGPVDPANEERFADVLIRPGPGRAVIQSVREPKVAALVGFHGGTTRAEVAVPLLRFHC